MQAKLDGKHIGRPSTTSLTAELITEELEEGATAKQIMDKWKVSKATYYRIKKAVVNKPQS